MTAPFVGQGAVIAFSLQVAEAYSCSPVDGDCSS